MSLKRFAMLSATSYQIPKNYNNNNNNNNTNYNNYNKTTFATTITPESTAKLIISNKSTLIQLKQQQQQIIAPIFLGTTATLTTNITTAVTFTPPSPLSTHSNSSIKHSESAKNYGTVNEIIANDVSNNSHESSESLDESQQTAPEHQHINTYTSTTYYGSGFGVFHQQNTRSNGGGIALISGSSANNGLGGGSYSNGINNNVNFLLGGAMLTLITTILCVVCYCCHRNIKKRTEAAYRQQRQWMENDPNMEIYSVEQCYETSGLFVGDSMDGLATIPALHHEPPPSYDAVVAMQEQQQLLMQQQQQQIIMQQQLSTNNSPPPGYRSSLDVSSILQQQQQCRATSLGGMITVDGSIISGMEINSLDSSNANLRTTTSISPIDPLFSNNDVNGNLATTVPSSTPTPTNHRTAPCYLRNKQQQQQHHISPATNQMNQLNMKKVLQAQSCCSLQRAEVENMWNAAAAALAARSAHLPTDSRASTAASSSSPTLAMNVHKLSKGCKTSTSNTPETFGTRYLRQNYYRRGCPLCGKFRYDNDSTLSISIDSNLDILAGTLVEETTTCEQDNNLQTKQNIVNNNECPSNTQEYEGNDNNIQADASDDEDDDNANEVEQKCSCSNSKGKNGSNSISPHLYHDANTQREILQADELQDLETKKPELTIPNAIPTTSDNNANSTLAAEGQSEQETASNNNNDITNMGDSTSLPSTIAGIDTETDTTIPRSPAAAASSSSANSTSSVRNVNLDCINENGIISLDMSKIIDKTGLPTYDAALKLESSGYV